MGVFGDFFGKTGRKDRVCPKCTNGPTGRAVPPLFRPGPAVNPKSPGFPPAEVVISIKPLFSCVQRHYYIFQLTTYRHDLPFCLHKTVYSMTCHEEAWSDRYEQEFHLDRQAKPRNLFLHLILPPLVVVLPAVTIVCYKRPWRNWIAH